MTDTELLHFFITEDSNAAFTQLTTRHAGLVYAAALRQTRATLLASDITQTVFLDLARHARKLRPDTHLPSWLITVTRRTAIDAIRRESRRRTREQTSAELATVNASHITPSSVSDLAPVLDEALDTLSDTDRRAVLLRFFENKSFREVGIHFSTTEATAQKRVTRALEKLRTQLARRGITTSAALLAAQLPLHASITIPATLATTLAAPAFLATAATLTTTAATFTQTLLMTATQKTVLSTALALTIAVVGVQTHRLTKLSHQHLALESQRIRDRQQLDSLTERLRNADTINASQQLPNTDPLAAHMHIILERIAALKQRLATHPEENIPEIAYLSADNWISIATRPIPENEEGFRSVMSGLRSSAVSNFVSRMSAALHVYLDKNNQTLPPTLTELIPYFKGPVDASTLERYELLATGRHKIAENPLLVRQKFATIVDEEYDSLGQIRWDIAQTVPVSQLRRELALTTPEGKERDRLERAMTTAIKKYKDANPNGRPNTPMDISAYFDDPADAARAFEMLEARKNQSLRP